MATPNYAHMSSQHVAAALKNIENQDPDLRIMSLIDLKAIFVNAPNEILKNDFSTSARTVDKVLNAFRDTNPEVQQAASACITPLIGKLWATPNVLGTLIEKMSAMAVDPKCEDNSTPALGCRALIEALPHPKATATFTDDVLKAYNSIRNTLLLRVLKALSTDSITKSDGKVNVNTDVLDLLTDIVLAYGLIMPAEDIANCQSIILSIFSNDKVPTGIRRRAISTMASLAQYAPDSSISSLVSILIESLRQPHLTNVSKRIYISTLGSLARSIPKRFGPYLKTIAPFVLQPLSQDEIEGGDEDMDDDYEQDPEVNDVREAALSALESFAAVCSDEMRFYTKETIDAALRFLTFDPNYNDDMDDDDMDEDDENDFGSDDEFDAADFETGEDDAAWKLRRAAARVLQAIIDTRSNGDLLEDGTLYSRIAPELVKNIKERNETTRLEIISALSLLVAKTGDKPVDASAVAEDYMTPQFSRKRRRDSSVTFDTKPQITMAAGLASPVIEALPSSGPRADLAKLWPQMVKAVVKQLNGSDLQAKQAIINFIANLATVLHGGLSNDLDQLLPPIIEAVDGTGPSASSGIGGSGTATVASLRVTALHLVAELCATHSSTVIIPHASKLVPSITNAAKDRNHKISAEALAAIEELIKTMTPPRAKNQGQDTLRDLQEIFSVITEQVSSSDTDSQVRSSSIHALAILIARTGSSHGRLLSEDNRAAGLNLLLESMQNENLLLPAVRGVDTICSLGGGDSFDAKWIHNVTLQLAQQFRKADRALRGASLGCLKNLLSNDVTLQALDDATIKFLVKELLPLYNTDDLHLLGPALLVTSYLVRRSPRTVAMQNLNDAICELLLTDIGGAVFDALLVLVRTLGEQQVGKGLMVGLLQKVSIKGTASIVGKTIGTLIAYGGAQTGVTQDAFIGELNKASSDDARKSLAMAVLGEVGLRLGAASKLQPDLFLPHLTNPQEMKQPKLPIAAAASLGRAAAGNMPVYMQVIIQQFDGDAHRQYLILHSVKEILAEVNNGNKDVDITPYTTALWPKLVAAALPEDNKAIGAECMGRLTIIDPKTYLPKLQANLKDDEAGVRAASIQAIRYALNDTDPAFDHALQGCLVEMLIAMLHDSNLENARLALSTTNSAITTKTTLIIPHLGRLMPLILNRSEHKPELVREVTMGPFKHYIDDGLEVRNSAYQTLDTLLDKAYPRFDVLALFDRVVAGLTDQREIFGFCAHMLDRLSVLEKEETRRRLDSIGEKLRTVLTAKLKDNAVKQEVDRWEDARRGALRLALLLHSRNAEVLGRREGMSDEGAGWREFLRWVDGEFKVALDEIKGESAK